MKKTCDFIMYGGAFNPPTIAHKRIGEYLIKKFDMDIIYLPTNSFYNKESLAPFKDRYKMTKLLVKDLGKRVKVSSYEAKKHYFTGTYYTLKDFNHPYFVIGADALFNLDTWIRGEDLIKENKFIVFPRKGYDIKEILKQNILNKYIDNFIIITDYEEDDVSSTSFRLNKDSSLLTEEVLKYIEKKGLYR